MLDVRARSATAPADTTVADTADGVEIKIGDPDTTVTGRHRYVLEYRLTGVVVDGRLAIDVIGAEWRAPIDSVDVRLRAPYGLNGVVCHQGETRSQARCDDLNVMGNSLRAQVSELDAYRGVTIYARAGAPASDAATALPARVDLAGGSDPYWWLRTIGLVLAVSTVGYVIGLIAVTRWARRAGRDLAWHGGGGVVDAVFGGPGLPARPIDDALADRQTTIQFVPPSGLTPAQGGVLLHEEVRDDHRVAWLAEHALEGWFVIEPGGKGLRWAAPDGKPAAPKPLRTIFANRDRVRLKKYDAMFAQGWDLIRDELTRWKDTSEYWDHAAEQRSKARAAVLDTLAVIAAIAGGIGLFFTAASFPWLAVLLAAVSSVLVGAGVAAQLNDPELAVRTPEGFAQRQLVEGFRRFFEQSEGRHAREAAERGDLRLYSAWAAALGELDRWRDAMAKAALPSSTRGVGDASRFVWLSAGAHAAVTPPSASIGGGGTGGAGGSYSGGGSSGVGGGAGGGGGGSW